MLNFILSAQANTMRTDTDQIYVRKWQSEDASALLSLAKDRNMKMYWSYSYPYTQRKAEACIQFFLHANPLRYAIYAVFINDQLYGWIQAKTTAYQCAEITFWLKKYSQNTAVLKAIITQMIPLAFDHLNILTLYMKTAMEEIPLRKALIQAGFIENNETVPIYLYFLHHFTLQNYKVHSHASNMHT